MLSENRQPHRRRAEAPARTSMNGLLPSPMVCADDAALSHAMLQSDGRKKMSNSFSSHDLKYSALERSSDSEDSRSGSGANSGKEASPGYAESSESEHSNGALLSDEAPSNDEYKSNNYKSMTRSRTTPILNGDWGLDDALKSLTQINTDIIPNNKSDPRHNITLNRIRAAHEENVNKLAYLETLFKHTKSNESEINSTLNNVNSVYSRWNTPDSRVVEKIITDVTPVSSYSPDSGYRSSPTSKDRKMKTSTSGPCLSSIIKSDEQTLVDGQSLLRNIESRLQRSQEVSVNTRPFYKTTGGSASVGSITRLTNSNGTVSHTSSNPGSRYTSPSRPLSTAPSRPLSTAPLRPLSTAPSRPLSTQPSTANRRTERPVSNRHSPTSQYYGGDFSLPSRFHSKTAYSSPAVSPQRGPDGSAAEAIMLRRLSTIDTRSHSELNSQSVRNLSLSSRHTAHGYPLIGSPLSPVSPAQGAGALQHKMNIFFEIMETQMQFSKVRYN